MCRKKQIFPSWELWITFIAYFRGIGLFFELLFVESGAEPKTASNQQCSTASKL